MMTTNKFIVYTILLMIVDIVLPLPIIGVLVIYLVVFKKPDWLKDILNEEDDE